MEASVAEPRQSRRWVIWLALVFIGISIVAGSIFFIRSRAQTAAEGESLTADTTTAFMGDLAAAATASGRVEARQTAALSVSQPGTVTEVLVSSGTAVETGDPLLVLDQRDLLLQVERMQQNLALKEANLQALLDGASAADLAAAAAAVQSAQAQLDDLLAGPSPEAIAEYEAAIRQQQAGIASASAAYNSVRGSVKESQLATAEAELLSAQIAYDKAKEANDNFAFSFTHEALVEAESNLNIARSKVEELKSGASQGSLNSAAADIAAAQANLNKSQADYEAFLGGPTASQISAAEAALARAISDLAELQAGPSAQDIAIAEAELEKARLDLVGAQKRLDEATLRAPFSGIVADVLLSEGEYASGRAVDLVSTELQVVLNVDELDIGRMQIGQKATITFEALPDVEIAGSIISISPSADNADGVITYDVLLTIETGELPVRVGMTADANLVTAEKANVLLVPNAAIIPNRQAGTHAVNLVVGQQEDGRPQTERREVVIGLRDDENTEILAGLAAGDVVQVGQLSAPTIDFSPPGFGGGDD